VRLCAQAESAVREGKLVLCCRIVNLVRGAFPRTRWLVTERCISTCSRPACAASATCWSRPGTAREPHHFACLIGYGATAVYPYMAYQCLFEMMRRGRVKLDFAARLELGRSYRAG